MRSGLLVKSCAPVGCPRRHGTAAGRGLQSEISLDAPLGPDGLGFDSVARLDLLASVEKQCGVRIPEPFWGSRPLLSLNHLLDIARE